MFSLVFNWSHVFDAFPCFSSVTCLPAVSIGYLFLHAFCPFRPVQMSATFERSISQANSVGRNILRAFGHPVAKCCDILGIENRISAHAWARHCCTIWPNNHNIKQHPQIMLHEKFHHFQI